MNRAKANHVSNSAARCPVAGHHDQLRTRQIGVTHFAPRGEGTSRYLGQANQK
jgi:hypothetical protein